MSAWSEYKKKMGSTRPWDMLNPNVERSSEEVSEERYAICLECPELIEMTKQCKQCGCFMKAKVQLQAAVCPLGKW